MRTTAPAVSWPKMRGGDTVPYWIFLMSVGQTPQTATRTSNSCGPMLGTGTIFTRNITSDPETGIGKWTEEQIFTTIKTMTKPDGKVIQGPMMFMQGMWSQLDDKDLHAVAAFIKKLPPVKNKVPDSTFKPNAGGPPPAPAAGSGSAAPAVGSGSAAAPAKKG